MTGAGFYEVHIATHQRGTSGVDYRTIHREMEAVGFKRMAQTTAQSANEVPGVYRLDQPQFTIEQVVQRVRGILSPLGWGMAVRILRIEEERLFDLLVAAGSAQMEEDSKARKRTAAEDQVEPQSGYPVWRRPR